MLLLLLLYVWRNAHDFAVLSVCTTDDRLYSATAADWSSRDSLIYSQPLRTEQHNSHWLNGAVHLPVPLSVSQSACMSVCVCRPFLSVCFLPNALCGVTKYLYVRFRLKAMPSCSFIGCVGSWLAPKRLSPLKQICIFPSSSHISL